MASEYKDYYKLLGVDKNADEKTIKAAYRKMARKYHPDVNQSDKTAEEKFKDISEAYDILSDTEKRAKYDQFGDQWRSYSQNGYPPQNGGGFSPGGQGSYARVDPQGMGGLDDLFSTLFGNEGGTGGGFGGGFRTAPRGGARSVTQSGDDVEYPVEITFAESYRGTTRSFTVTIPETCPHCHGNGRIPSVSHKQCAACAGSGKTRGRSSLFATNNCEQCEGTGEAMEICPDCHGRGVLEKQRRLTDIRIPAGVKEGQRVRLAGQGTSGSDIYLKISIRADARYERKGDDIVTEFEVPYTVAALGGEASVETLDGRKSLQIPGGTQTGQAFRLSGLGMPHLKGGSKGNLLARAKITVPKTLSPRERELLRDLASLHHDEIKV